MIKYVLGAALVAMFVIPGSASELSAMQASASAHAGLAASYLFSDPDTEPTLSITLPTKFVAVDTTVASGQHFAI